MAIVDANYCFQYVHIGCQGRISDGGVYKNTSFYKELKENIKNTSPRTTTGDGKIDSICLGKSITSRPLYTPPGSFDTEDLENGVIVNGAWRQITSNDKGLTHLHVPRRPPMDAKLVREELKVYFMTPQEKVEWQDMYQ
ncbi:unnamed protein product [Euphydryas editha]|uniref:Uncharacterized protein n=1 Tax=Euphydryas editha TaxID=104508 RepID=A0AAU9VCW3_EUPED|nr:unnamed protein product [Euphydryas editha]